MANNSEVLSDDISRKLNVVIALSLRQLLGDKDFTICGQQLDVRHRSIVEHGCFLF